MDFKQTEANGNYKFKQYHENYGFELEKVLAQYPIKELASEQYKANLIDSLNKGNLQSATFIKDNVEIKNYIEANPQFKTINIYEGNGARLNKEQHQEIKQGKSMDANLSMDEKKTALMQGSNNAINKQEGSEAVEKRQGIKV